MNETTRMARKSDPTTSHVAAEEHVERGKLGERQQQVLKLIRRFPGRTTGELGRNMYALYGSNLGIRSCAETPHKRAPELEAKGLVRRGAARKCKDSGYTAATWYPI